MDGVHQARDRHRGGATLPGEDVLIIDVLPGVATLLDRLAAFRYSVFRLEALQDYRGSGEEDARAAFQAGQPLPLTPALRAWAHMVRQRVRSGCVVQRVHVVTSPLTDYIRFELASYAPNVEAGEDVRVVPVPEGGLWPLDVPQDDFWLIDSSELWSQCYDRDGTRSSALNGGCGGLASTDHAAARFARAAVA